jgi:glyoxylase-like metal-dependent hydrolase (beta-lactamase superfamily II)
LPRFLARRLRGTSPAARRPIDAMVVTHGEADHFAGLSRIRDEVPPLPHRARTSHQRAEMVFALGRPGIAWNVSGFSFAASPLLINYASQLLGWVTERERTTRRACADGDTV